MGSEKYCVIGFGCILSEKQILCLYKRYLPDWELENGFNMDSLVKNIIKENKKISSNIKFYHDCYSYNNVFFTINILEDTSRYKPHSYKDFNFKIFNNDYIFFLNKEMEILINILKLEINDFGWKLYNYRI